VGEIAAVGYQTDFIGDLHVQPALGGAEIDLVNRISRSLHVGQEASELRAVDALEAALRELTPCPPRGWSNWWACAGWLKYLLETFLVPGAAVSGHPAFEDFSCDHVLNGMVVGSRRDTREPFSITARENDVEVGLLWPGVPEWSDYAPLPYEQEIDRFREWLVDHRLKEARDRVRALRAEYQGIDDV
jgi:hypothetical protein